jgi:hypothetical protein
MQERSHSMAIEWINPSRMMVMESSKEKDHGSIFAAPLFVGLHVVGYTRKGMLRIL